MTLVMIITDLTEHTRNIIGLYRAYTNFASVEFFLFSVFFYKSAVNTNPLMFIVSNRVL